MNFLRNYYFIEFEQCLMCRADNSFFKKIGKRSAERQKFLPKKGFSIDIFRCKKCGLVFANPMPLPKNISIHYEIAPEAFWQNIKPHSKEYLNQIFYIFKPFINEFSDVKALDIGSGLGHLITAFNMNGLISFGVEPSNSFIEKACEIYNLPRERFYNTTFENFVCSDNYYDIITCLAVLEHVPDPNALIEKALRILKPGGLLFLEIPSSKWLISKILNIYYKLIFTKFVTHLSPLHPPYHLYEFSPESFYRNSKLLNYEVVDIKYFVCNKMFPSFMDKPLKWIMKKTNTGMELFVVIRKK